MRMERASCRCIDSSHGEEVFNASQIQAAAEGRRRSARGQARRAAEVEAARSVAADGEIDERERAGEDGQRQAQEAAAARPRRQDAGQARDTLGARPLLFGASTPVLLLLVRRRSALEANSEIDAYL